jgi:hypothetical protein
MVTLARNISLSLKLLLSFLFGVLLLAESIDGVNDVSDWAVPFFFILMFNDFVVHSQVIKGKTPLKWTLSERIKGPSDKVPLKKMLMNVFIVLMLLGSFALELSGLDAGVREEIFKGGFVLWSLFFLVSNIYHLRSRFKLSRLVVTNIAFFLFVGSLTLI